MNTENKKNKIFKTLIIVTIIIITLVSVKDIYNMTYGKAKNEAKLKVVEVPSDYVERDSRFDMIYSTPENIDIKTFIDKDGNIVEQEDSEILARTEKNYIGKPIEIFIGPIDMNLDYIFDKPIISNLFSKQLVKIFQYSDDISVVNINGTYIIKEILPPKNTVPRYTYYVRGEGNLEGKVIAFTVANSDMNREEQDVMAERIVASLKFK